jgi:hypothetical protein
MEIRSTLSASVVRDRSYVTNNFRLPDRQFLHQRLSGIFDNCHLLRYGLLHFYLMAGNHSRNVQNLGDMRS